MHLVHLGSPPGHERGTGGQHYSPVLSVCPKLEGELHHCVFWGLAVQENPVIGMTVEQSSNTSVMCQRPQLGMVHLPDRACADRESQRQLLGLRGTQHKRQKHGKSRPSRPDPSRHSSLWADVTSFR